MRTGPKSDNSRQESGVSLMIEYVLISGIMTGLMIVILIMVNANFMEGPATTLSYSAFTDIGNGVSTRIVDVYAIAPEKGNITTRFDIPDDVAGRTYSVDVGNMYSTDLSTQVVSIYRDTVMTNVSIAGIGTSRKAGGSTTGKGLNIIRYDSGGMNT